MIVDGSYQFVSENILEGKHTFSAQVMNFSKFSQNSYAALSNNE